MPTTYFSEKVLDHFSGTKFLVFGKKYHTELPEQLGEWYCYTTDGGHCILTLIAGHFDVNEENLKIYLVPAPVKAVLRSYQMHNGYPLAHLEYDEELGLISDDEDEEW